MNAFVGWGIALVVLGLLLTFSNLLGFLPGVPLLAIGILLVVIGVVVWVVGLPFRAAGAMRRRT